MTEPVTAEQVKAAVLGAGITWIKHHTCACCDEWVAYLVEDGELFFDSSCGCASSRPQPRAWNDLAEWINEQTEEVHRQRIMKDCGFKEQP